MQSLQGRHVLVTGANGGLGEQFVAQGLERGAARSTPPRARRGTGTTSASSRSTST